MIKLTRDEIGTIKTIAYHEGVSGGVLVYLQGNGEFFDDRHPDYYDNDWYDESEYACPNFCCSCCGCDCGYYYGDYDYDDEEPTLNGVPISMISIEEDDE